MRRQQFALNDIFSERTRPKSFIYHTKHWLVDRFQICSNAGPGVQNGPSAGEGGLGFENKIFLKIFSRTASLGCLKFCM